MTQGRAGPEFSAALTALGLSSGLIPSPSGLGSHLAVGPPGLASMAILRCHFFLNLPQASRLLGMTKGKSGASMGNRIAAERKSRSLHCAPLRTTIYVRQVEKKETAKSPWIQGPEGRHQT